MLLFSDYSLKPQTFFNFLCNFWKKNENLSFLSFLLGREITVGEEGIVGDRC